MKKFFQGLSFSSIVAGTLAAVTSFLLAAKIGVAGSVIGAAASYIVSVVATNIYKNLITASSEKFQQTLGNSGSADAEDDDEEGGESSQPAIDRDADGTAKADLAEDAGADAIRERSGHELAQDRAAESQGAASARRPREIISRPNDGHTYSITELRKHRHDPKRVAVIVTLVSGLLTVAVTAGIVMLVTQGHGTDTVVSDLVSPATSSDSTNDDDDSIVQPHRNDRDPQYGQSDQGTGTENGTTDNTTTDSTNSSGSTNSDGTGSTNNNSGTGSANNSGTTGSTGSSGSDSTGSSGTNGSGTSGDTSGSTGSDSTSGSTSTGSGSDSSSSGSSNSSGSNTGSNEGVSFSPIR